MIRIKSGGCTAEQIWSVIINMDVRIGVVEHTLLQAKLKDKSNMQKDMHSLHLQNEENNYYMWTKLQIKYLLRLTLLNLHFL